MTPAAISNVLKSTRFATEGALTMRGDPIVDDLSPWNIALRAIGYSPAPYARALEAVSQEKRVYEGIRRRKANLYRKFYLARKSGDAEEMRALQQEMARFNEDHPTEAITRRTLAQSMAQYDNRTEEMVRGVSFSPRYRKLALENLSDYDEDVSLWTTL